MTADLWSPQTSGNSLVGLSSLRTQEQVPRSHNSLSMETEDKNGDFLFRGQRKESRQTSATETPRNAARDLQGKFFSDLSLY